MLRVLPNLPAAFRDAAAALLFPTPCRVCGAMIASLEEGVTCRRCWGADENAQLDFDYCAKCDVSLPRLLLQPQTRRCGLCDEHAYLLARAGGHYRGALRENVLQLKLRPALPPRLHHLLQFPLAQLTEAHTPELILPVPLHPTRQQERSFNQAEIIGQAVAQATGLPLYATALRRIKATEKHRVGMDAQARQKSIAGAFAVPAPRLVAERTVLLVDDVMTTGATAHEIAHTLLANGARAVLVLAAARAVAQHLP